MAKSLLDYDLRQKVYDSNKTIGNYVSFVRENQNALSPQEVDAARRGIITRCRQILELLEAEHGRD